MQTVGIMKETYDFEHLWSNKNRQTELVFAMWKDGMKMSILKWKVERQWVYHGWHGMISWGRIQKTKELTVKLHIIFVKPVSYHQVTKANYNECWHTVCFQNNQADESIEQYSITILYMYWQMGESAQWVKLCQRSNSRAVLWIVVSVMN